MRRTFIFNITGIEFSFLSYQILHLEENIMSKPVTHNRTLNEINNGRI